MAGKEQSIKNLTVRIDSDLHEQATALFDELGLDMTGAIRMFLRQAVREQAIPFAITMHVDKPAKPAYELIKLSE